MRWKVGNTNYVSGAIKIAGRYSDLCIYDNGTSICGAGHRLTTVGTCVSQSVGTVNSSGYTPTYSVCSSDYVDGSNTYVSIYNNSVGVDGFFSVGSLGGSEVSFNELLSSTSIDYIEQFYVKSLSKSQSFYFLSSLGENSAGYSMYLDLDYIDGVFGFLSRNSGWIQHGVDAFSDFYQYDVFGTVSSLSPFYFQSKFTVDEKIVLVENPTGFVPEIKILVEGDETVCVGDNIEPSLENISPLPGTHLNSSTEEIRFDIVDAIGGVDLSSIYVTVSGNLTSQPEGMSIITAGSPIAQVSIGGTEERFSIVYTPTSTWAQNEVILVTVTGSDNVPDGPDDEPFSCYSGNPNTFGNQWSYKVENTNDFSASIVAIADVTAPYLSGVYPAMWFGGISSDSDIYFYILDDLSGVDLDSIFVYINGVVVVSFGAPVISGVTITEVTGGYYFYYTNSTGFAYGNRITVRVVATDKYEFSPNMLDFTYYFDIISSSTLRIENFYPEVGVTFNPESVYIKVDVIDEVYDIDESGLYLSINGVTCSSSVENIYGLRYLTSTVSGVEELQGTSVNNSESSWFSAYGVSIIGATASGGSITEGVCVGGTMSDFPPPFDLTLSGYIVDSYITSGDLVSCIVDSALISGVNWDGKLIDSTISGVSVSSLFTSDTTVTGTVISGTVGRHLEYHPDNDFDYTGTINVLVHGTNLSSVAPVVVESIYQLFHGYNVRMYDRTFNHNSRVNIFLGAENTQHFKNKLDYGYYFTTIDQPIKDLTATIVGITPWEDLIADISPQGPIHRYGEIVQVEIYVEDVEGNAFGPYILSYTIEEGS